MNRSEWLNAGKPKNEYKKIVKDLLQKWKTENNITEQCVVHHRDDTEETRDYNEKYYERWGCNVDDTFEYGKYVIFLTHTEHMRHHFTGEKHPMYGKCHTEETLKKMSEAQKGKRNHMYGKHPAEETLKKMSEAHKGKTLSDETKMKMSAKNQAAKILYTTYKENGGNKSWNDFRKAIASGDITFETYPVSVFINMEPKDESRHF